jgi:hypothetical protein
MSYRIAAAAEQPYPPHYIVIDHRREVSMESSRNQKKCRDDRHGISRLSF